MTTLLILSLLAIIAGVIAEARYPIPTRVAISKNPFHTSYDNDSTLPNFGFHELYQLQLKFLDHYLYPADATEAKSINSTLLAEDIQGRIDITRTFEGRELNTEYLFGLFANLAATPNSLTLLGYPVSYEIMHFSANQYMASASTRFLFNFTAINKQIPVIIDTWNAWNAQGQIVQYDASFKYWQWLVDTLIEAAAPALNATTYVETITALTKGLALSICTTATKYCTGDNLQYANATACFEYLTQDVRFGSAYELGRNTLICRMVHQNMVPFRPSIHCPHIGITGGGYCVDDTTYLSTVEDDYFKLPFVPYGY